MEEVPVDVAVPAVLLGMNVLAQIVLHLDKHYTINVKTAEKHIKWEITCVKEENDGNIEKIIIRDRCDDSFW